MSNLFKISEEAICSITEKNNQNYCKHVLNLEKEYWDKDGIIEKLCDPLCFSVNSDTETGSDSEYSSNE